MKNKLFTKFIMSIEETSKGQEVRVAIRIFGSLIVALSGLILFSDKVISFEFSNNFGFKNTPTFLWVLSQSLSPFLLVIASVFKPFKTSYLVPVYFYFIQLYWVFDPSVMLDNALLHIYASGVCIIFLLLAYVISSVSHMKRRKDIEKELIIQEAKKTIELFKEKILTTKAS